MKNKGLDLDRCRVCSADGVLLDLFESKSRNVSYAENVRKCLSVQIEPNDGLPSKICIKCVGLITDCLPFVDCVLKLLQNKGNQHPSFIPDDNCYYCLSSENYLFPIPEASVKKTHECFNLAVVQNLKICHRCQFYLDSIHDLKQKVCESQEECNVNTVSSAEKNFPKNKLKKEKRTKEARKVIEAEEGKKEDTVNDILHGLLRKCNMEAGGSPFVKTNNGQPRVVLVDIGISLGKDVIARGTLNLNEYPLITNYSGNVNGNSPSELKKYDEKCFTNKSKLPETCKAPVSSVHRGRNLRRLSKCLDLENDEVADTGSTFDADGGHAETDRVQKESSGKKKRAADLKKTSAVESGLTTEKIDRRKRARDPSESENEIVSQKPRLSRLSGKHQSPEASSLSPKSIMKVANQNNSSSEADCLEKEPKTSTAVLENTENDNRKSHPKPKSKRNSTLCSNDVSISEADDGHTTADNIGNEYASKKKTKVQLKKTSIVIEPTSLNLASTSEVEDKKNQEDDCMKGTPKSTVKEPTIVRKRVKTSSDYFKFFGDNRVLKTSDPPRFRDRMKRPRRGSSCSDGDSGLDESTVLRHGNTQIPSQPSYLKEVDELLKFTPKTKFKPFICSVCHEGYVSTVKGKLHKLIVHDPHSNVLLKLKRCDNDPEMLRLKEISLNSVQSADFEEESGSVQEVKPEKASGDMISDTNNKEQAGEKKAEEGDDNTERENDDDDLFTREEAKTVYTFDDLFGCSEDKGGGKKKNDIFSNSKEKEIDRSGSAIAVVEGDVKSRTEEEVSEADENSEVLKSEEDSEETLAPNDKLNDNKKCCEEEEVQKNKIEELERNKDVEAGECVMENVDEIDIHESHVELKQETDKGQEGNENLDEEEASNKEREENESNVTNKEGDESKKEGEEEMTGKESQGEVEEETDKEQEENENQDEDKKTGNEREESKSDCEEDAANEEGEESKKEGEEGSKKEGEEEMTEKESHVELKQETDKGQEGNENIDEEATDKERAENESDVTNKEGEESNKEGEEEMTGKESQDEEQEENENQDEDEKTDDEREESESDCEEDAANEEGEESKKEGEEEITGKESQDEHPMTDKNGEECEDEEENENNFEIRKEKDGESKAVECGKERESCNGIKITKDPEPSDVPFNGERLLSESGHGSSTVSISKRLKDDEVSSSGIRVKTSDDISDNCIEQD